MAVDVHSRGADRAPPSPASDQPFSTAANVITFDVTCPLTRSIDLEYTATANSFVFRHGSDPNEVATATKQ